MEYLLGTILLPFSMCGIIFSIGIIYGLAKTGMESMSIRRVERKKNK